MRRKCEIVSLSFLIDSCLYPFAENLLGFRSISANVIGMKDFCIENYFPEYKSTIICFSAANISIKLLMQSIKRQTALQNVMCIRTFCFDQSMNKFKQILEKEEKEQRINSSS